jgi:predicted ABC-type transport system involved in lysophospholipase L1 biosynthesis ATPase subunit
MSEEAILVLRGVTRTFPVPGSESGLTVLRDVNLAVSAGETVSVVGPSGSGKSTLLNIMGALDRPDSGEALLAGNDLSTLDDAGLARVRNREVGFVFQLHHLLPQCTVLENVLVPTLAGGRRSSPPEAVERATVLLDRVGLSERRAYRPGLLSGGERQRVAVVRALINRPKLVLADEPTGALDAGTAGRLAGLLFELQSDEGFSLVTVTHSAELAGRAGRRFHLRNGQLAELTEEPGGTS